MRRLSEADFLLTFGEPMTRVDDPGVAPPFDFWGYFQEIPESDFEGHDCSAGAVDYVWRDPTGRFEHVLVSSEDNNVFMVLVLDRRAQSVHGHRLLDLRREYGLLRNVTDAG